MEKTTRKPNRLKNYDYSQNGVYFITVCTKDMKCVLSHIENKALVGADTIRPKVKLKPYGIIVENSINQITKHYEGVFVDNYCIMPNHIHILLRIDRNEFLSVGADTIRPQSNTDFNGRMVSAPTISVIIGSLKRYVSKQLRFSIWQKGFHDHIIRDEDDFLLHWQYIDENPKKWIMGKDEYYG